MTLEEVIALIRSAHETGVKEGLTVGYNKAVEEQKQKDSEAKKKE